MSAVLFPSDIIVTINRPLDGKSNVLTITERDAIPVTQRYKGMIVVVQNTGATRPQIFWLPTNNLTNTGWEELCEAPSYSDPGTIQQIINNVVTILGNNAIDAYAVDNIVDSVLGI